MGQTAPLAEGADTADALLEGLAWDAFGRRYDSFTDRRAYCARVASAVGAKTIGLDEKTGRVVTCAPKFGPKPAPVKGGAKPKAPILTGTFEAIVIGAK